LGKDETPYVIRHTVAKALRKRGVPAWEAAGFLGHELEGYGTTGIYAKWQPDYLGAAARAVEDYFRELARQ
jgi:site-specific recombinase XerD